GRERPRGRAARGWIRAPRPPRADARQVSTSTQEKRPGLPGLFENFLPAPLVAGGTHATRAVTGGTHATRAVTERAVCLDVWLVVGRLRLGSVAPRAVTGGAVTEWAVCLDVVSVSGDLVRHSVLLLVGRSRAVPSN